MGKKLSYKELLSNLNGLTVRKLVPAARVGSSKRRDQVMLCPDCGVTSHSRHGRYWRKLRDLPLPGASFTLKLQMGRWRCRSRRCWRHLLCQHSWQVVVTENSIRVENAEVPSIHEFLLLPRRALFSSLFCRCSPPAFKPAPKDEFSQLKEIAGGGGIRARGRTR
jgi:zinc-finger of transposase IS204/IS1001/IS1096/IS1165